MIPQLIMLAITLLSLGIAMEQHGKPKTGKHSVWTFIIAATIQLGLLYWGGFFDVFFK